MNIFYLDKDAKTAAQYHCDKHVVKMILEYAQLMSTAHRLLDGDEAIVKINNRNRRVWTLNDHREQTVYKPVSWNHPSAVWVRQSLDHYQWLWNLAIELCQEYRHRYGGTTDKQHKTSVVIQNLSFAPDNIPRLGMFSEPPQAMPDDSKVPGDSVTAYRNYYRMHKKRFATWKNREVPNWYK
jgi:hypothetical protein